MKNPIPFLALAVASAASSLSAATLYDLSTVKLDGTAGENTYIVSNSQPASLSYNSSTPSLTWNEGSSFTYFLGYFASTALVNVNDSITISYAITPSSALAFNTNSGAFRVGLFSSAGSTKITSNLTGTGSPAFVTYNGYEGFYRPNGTPVAGAEAFYQRNAAGSSDVLVGAAGNSAMAGSPTLVSPGTGNITGSFTITLSAVGQTTLTSIINGGIAQTVVDTSGIVSSFDSFGFLSFAGTSNPSLTFTNLTVSSVPEPSTYALIGLATVAAGVIFRRRARRNRV